MNSELNTGEYIRTSVVKRPLRGFTIESGTDTTQPVRNLNSELNTEE